MDAPKAPSPPPRGAPARTPRWAPSPRLLKFGLVGASGVIINLGLLFLLVRHAGLHYALASPLAIEASILSNYVGNRVWTWRDRRVGPARLFHFHGVSLIGMALQWATVVAAVELLQIHYLLASVFGIGLATAWNFVAHHHFTFAREDSPVLRRLARPLLYASALALQMLLAVIFVHAWDGFVFERTTENLARGETPYATIEDPPAYVFNRAYVPPYAEWYAYPPLPLLLFAAASWPHVLYGLGNEAVQRVLWKLPILLAGLALPWLARRLAEAHGAQRSTAQRLERILLFNPLLLVIGPAWGMTEPILLALLVASLLALQRGRVASSGILFGLSSLVKIFPLLLYPILLAHLARGPRGWSRAARHASAAAATWLAVSLPFAAPHPKGFLELVLLMHVKRPPNGYSLFVPIQETLALLAGSLTAARVGPLLGILGLSFYALIVLGVAARVRARGLTQAHLPLLLGLTYLVFLLCNKVVNPQYLLILLVLLAIACAIPVTQSPALARFVPAFSVAAATATLLDSLRLIQLVPPDLSALLLGTHPNQFILHLRTSLGLSHAALVGITGAFSVLLILWATRSLAQPLAAHVRTALSAAHDAAHHLPHPSLPRPSRARVAAGLLLAILLLPTASVGLLVQVEPEPTPALAPLGDRLLGAYYYLWWDNPSNNYDARYGNWDYATTTPLLGYYSSYPGEIARALAGMKAVGIDFALVPVYAHDHTRFETLAYQAERAGLRFAPLFDLSTLAQPQTRTPAAGPTPLPLTLETTNAARAYFQDQPRRALESPNLLQLDPGRPVLFLEGARLLGDPENAAQQARLAELVADQESPDLLDRAVGNATWTRDSTLLTPTHFASAARPDLLAQAWDQAERNARDAFWTQVLQTIYARVPNATFILAEADLEHVPIPPERIADTYQAWGDVRPGAERNAGPAGFATLWPQYNASLVRPADPIVPAFDGRGLRLAHQWAGHLDQPRILLHAWNEHQEAAAIEPTWEWGDRFLDATQRWSHHWRTMAT